MIERDVYETDPNLITDVIYGGDVARRPEAQQQTGTAIQRINGAAGPDFTLSGGGSGGTNIVGNYTGSNPLTLEIQGADADPLLVIPNIAAFAGTISAAYVKAEMQALADYVNDLRDALVDNKYMDGP